MLWNMLCVCDRLLATDSSFSVNASAMIDAKECRKRAENDLQLVANRIALLRYEEQVRVCVRNLDMFVYMWAS
jgi:hypothetical protein